MVKNFGGNKSKKFGRKHLGGGGGNKALRMSQDEDEMYACVSKLLGNGMCHVIGIDQCQRLCIIRNKFRGRSKRSNTLNPGTWILIGLRSWQTKVNSSKETCDLLEVYNEREVSQLKDSVDLKWDTFKGIGDVHNQHLIEDTSDLGFEVGGVDEFEEEQLNAIKSELDVNNNTSFIAADEDMINIDDI